MRLLIIGHSNIVRRRVLPAALGVFSKVDLATRRPPSDIQWPESQRGEIFSNYDEALKNSKAEWVYVSLPNHMHDEWGLKALQSQRNVIVDKPAFTNLRSAENLINVSEKQSRALVEATVYAAHPQVEILKDLPKELGTQYSRMMAQFSVPPFEPNNFRYKKEMSGGALMDLGPYAVSVARLFMPGTINDLSLQILSRRGDVETAFSLMMKDATGFSFVGQFGFDTEYSNYLRLLGPDICAWSDRIFTTAPDQGVTLNFRSKNKDGQRIAPAADSFKEFFKNVLAASSDQMKTFKDNLWADATLLDRLIKENS